MPPRQSKNSPSIPAIAVRCVLTASSHLVPYRIIDSRGHLADADLRTKRCDTEVSHHILLNLHDALQAQAPPHKKTEGAYVERQPGAAAPTPQGFPEWADTADRIAVGHAHHWATESLNTNPWVFVALADAVLEVFAASISRIQPHSFFDRIRHKTAVQDAKENLEN